MIAVKNYKASEEVANFIAMTNPAKVLAFRPSAETAQRVSDLIEREKTESISAEEKHELDYYMQLEHLMRMAKIFARKKFRKAANSKKIKNEISERAAVAGEE